MKEVLDKLYRPLLIGLSEKLTMMLNLDRNTDHRGGVYVTSYISGRHWDSLAPQWYKEDFRTHTPKLISTGLPYRLEAHVDTVLIDLDDDTIFSDKEIIPEVITNIINTASILGGKVIIVSFDETSIEHTHSFQKSAKRFFTGWDTSDAQNPVWYAHYGFPEPREDDSLDLTNVGLVNTRRTHQDDFTRSLVNVYDQEIGLKIAKIAIGRQINQIRRTVKVYSANTFMKDWGKKRSSKEGLSLDFWRKIHASSLIPVLPENAGLKKLKEQIDNLIFHETNIRWALNQYDHMGFHAMVETLYETLKLLKESQTKKHQNVFGVSLSPRIQINRGVFHNKDTERKPWSVSEYRPTLDNLVHVVYWLLTDSLQCPLPSIKACLKKRVQSLNDDPDKGEKLYQKPIVDCDYFLVRFQKNGKVTLTWKDEDTREIFNERCLEVMGEYYPEFGD